ncbi:MFS transporter [Nocardia lasii]|uniref:MFS transporter n=1 Tax=Nocardia lasii TaxID=1616107 RepID=A0ABW1JLF5_9NOCA
MGVGWGGSVESVSGAWGLRLSRVAVFGAFTLSGILLALWVVHIPAITAQTGVSPATLGVLVLLMAGAALVGMRAAGPAADRFGSRTLVGVAAATVSVTIVGPALATDAVTLAIALACYGIGNGALDVSMNTQAVFIERAYGRPIMSAFHAMFSGGAFAGALLGAATQRAGWSPQLTLTCASVAGLVVTVLLVPRLVAHPDAPAQALDSGTKRPDRSRKVLALGAVAFVLLLAEGVAADWSALQARDHLGVSESDAALAFGAFSATMTLGRFLADRVSAAIGPVAVLRYGSLLAAGGFAVIIASPWLPLTLLGWALCGLGLAGGVPQIFTTAGNLGGTTAATDMSRVFTIGYLGLLAGPAFIGWLTALVPLTAALTVPLILTLACAGAAHIVTPRG